LSLATGITVTLLLFSIYVFRRFEDTFADVV